MSVDSNKFDRQLELIEIRKEKLKKEKLLLMKKKKQTDKKNEDYFLKKMGEIFFDGFKVESGKNFINSKNALLTMIDGSKLNDKDKKKVSDLLESLVTFERAKPRLKKEVDLGQQDQEGINSNLHYQADR